MSAKWFVILNGRQHGPCTPQQLRQGVADATITLTTKIRKGTDGQWVNAGKVNGLFPPQSANPTKSQSQQINDFDVIEWLGTPTVESDTAFSSTVSLTAPASQRVVRSGTLANADELSPKQSHLTRYLLGVFVFTFAAVIGLSTRDNLWSKKVTQNVAIVDGDESGSKTHILPRVESTIEREVLARQEREREAKWAELERAELERLKEERVKEQRRNQEFERQQQEEMQAAQKEAAQKEAAQIEAAQKEAEREELIDDLQLLLKIQEAPKLYVGQEFEVNVRVRMEFTEINTLDKNRKAYRANLLAGPGLTFIGNLIYRADDDDQLIFVTEDAELGRDMTTKFDSHASAIVKFRLMEINYRVRTHKNTLGARLARNYWGIITSAEKR